MLGQIVTVTVDRKMGTRHPHFPELVYPVNYGYIRGISAPDGEDQDAYILGINEPVNEFTGKVIAIIHRKEDVEEKWVVIPREQTLSREEIAEQVKFQKQYFTTYIEM